MDWILISKLIIEVGYPAAMQLWKNAQERTNATQAQWDDLDAKVKQTARDRFKAQLVAAGVALDSPQAVALLALTGA